MLVGNGLGLLVSGFGLVGEVKWKSSWKTEGLGFRVCKLGMYWGVQGLGPPCSQLVGNEGMLKNMKTAV